MDAIISVENEVEKVLRLFSDCRQDCNLKIDNLVGIVEDAKKEIHALSNTDDNTLSTQQISIIQATCVTIQKICSQITNAHRDLHVPVSRIGKSIDKNFNADFASSVDKRLFSSRENSRLVNQAIIQHLCRQGMSEVASELISDSNPDMYDIELTKFTELNDIVATLRRGDIQPALDWAIKNRDRLSQIDSPLEFKLHRIHIINLFKQGVEKRLDIINYARENLQRYSSIYDTEIQQLMGGLAFLKSGLNKSPYKFLFDTINYEEIENIFISNGCALSNFSIKSPISIAIEAGCIALPALLNINQMLAKQNVLNVWQLRDELPVEIDLGRKLQFHSRFSCPILKQQSTEANPPMRLICGHVISLEALNKLSNTSNGNKLKCPYCPIEQRHTEAKRIYF